jgi:uncharacterized protein
MSLLRILFAVLMLGTANCALAEVAVPALRARVTDQTATLSAEQKANLEQSLAAFEARKGSQLALLIVPTTQPETIEQYSLRVAEQWKIGRGKIDDGAILLVAKDDHALRIEVGYGLEGALNDATAKRIVSEIIVPRFKQNDFYGGIAAGLAQMMKVVDGEPLPAPVAHAERGGGGVQNLFPIIFMVTLVVGEIARAMLGRLPGALVTGGVVSLIAWFFVGGIVLAVMVGVVASLFTLMGGMMGRGIGGGGFGGGLGGGFGGRGGGFSGGGGGFGGGGASGRW